MTDGWTSWALYDIAEYQNGRPNRPSELGNTGLPVVRIPELRRGVDAGTDRVDVDVEDRHLVRRGDLLFSWSGTIVIAVWQGPDAVLNQHIFRVKAKPWVDQRFLRYLLESQVPVFERIVRDQATSMGHVKVADLRRLPAQLPPIEEQRAIASVLGALDDKIELNRRMCETLEALARAIFTSWFVDFDPVRAKAEGRQPVGMDAETASLFPDSFTDSPLGLIPSGWHVLPLDRLANFLNGLALQRYPPTGNGELPVIKIPELRSGVTGNTGRASTEVPDQYLVADGDVLFSWSGSLVAVLWSGGVGALNQHLFRVTSGEYPRWLYYLWIGRHMGAFRAIAAGKATTMGHIQRVHLSQAQCVVPPTALLDRATSLLEPMLDAIVNNGTQSRLLATMRDTLLPKLVSGALRLPPF